MLSLPVILRARDFRLYTQGGGRLVDLWQAGGRAILGHTPAGVFRDFKNYASRGLLAPFPHPQEQRLARALSRLLPGRVFRFYTDLFSLRSALEAAGFPWRDPLPDPALPGGLPPAGDPDSGPLPALWRPFLDEGESPPEKSPESPRKVPRSRGPIPYWSPSSPGPWPPGFWPWKRAWKTVFPPQAPFPPPSWPPRPVPSTILSPRGRGEAGRFTPESTGR
ncbi:MAG: hypothetical protein LBB77_12320, partial [Treponema sp.]|nr:hypothetical protein [Treponema sp.]